MIKTLIILLFSTSIFAQTLEEQILQMRERFEQDKLQASTLEKLDQEQQMIDAYVKIVAARRQCDKLGIDCQTGESKQSTQSKLLEIEQEQLLIDAYTNIFQKRKDCKNLNINCKTGEKITFKKRVKPKVVITKDQIPPVPELSGYYNNTALFFNQNKQIKQYKNGDKFASGWEIVKIIPNDKVTLKYKNITRIVE